MIDSLNRHDLKCYVDTPAHTPNISRLADLGCVFDNHFSSSAPCMRARRELLTGRQKFLWRWCGHLKPWDRNLAVEARQAGTGQPANTASLPGIHGDCWPALATRQAPHRRVIASRAFSRAARKRSW